MVNQSYLRYGLQRECLIMLSYPVHKLSKMKAKMAAFNLLVFSGCSLLITVATYFVNLWLFFGNERFSPTDLLFIEGMICFIIGLLLLLGRGGIGPTSRRAAILSALAGAVFGEDTVGPSEIYRRDAWKPKGFTRLALILMIAGAFMILAYFLTL